MGQESAHDTESPGLPRGSVMVAVARPIDGHLCSHGLIHASVLDESHKVPQQSLLGEHGESDCPPEGDIAFKPVAKLTGLHGTPPGKGSASRDSVSRSSFA